MRIPNIFKSISENNLLHLLLFAFNISTNSNSFIEVLLFQFVENSESKQYLTRQHELTRKGSSLIYLEHHVNQPLPLPATMNVLIFYFILTLPTGFQPYTHNLRESTPSQIQAFHLNFHYTMHLWWTSCPIPRTSETYSTFTFILFFFYVSLTFSSI